jgi:transposase-like protein
MCDAPPQEKGENRRDAIVERSQREFPALCRGLLDEAEASLNPLAVPKRPQQDVRTANLVARAFVDERRRTKVLPHLWTEGSLVPLVFGVLIRVSERWGKRGFSDIEQPQLRSFRERLKLEEHEVRINEPAIHAQSRRSVASAA